MSILRTHKFVIKGGEEPGGARRSLWGHDSKQSIKIKEISKVSGVEKEEDCCTTTESMESDSDSESGPGFSDPWSLAEQEPSWYRETIQKQATLDMGSIQLGEDFDGNEVGPYPSDLLDSDGCSSSG